MTIKSNAVGIEGLGSSNFNTAPNAEPTGGAANLPLRYWLFQANPENYDIHASLAEQKEELWNLRQHAGKVRVGDRVVIWLCGASAGIYAVGTVVTPVVIQTDSPTGQAYWNTADGLKRYARVTVRYDRVMLEHPLFKTFVLTDPVLSGLKVLAMPRATNYAISAEEWAALQGWLESMPATPSVVPLVPFDADAVSDKVGIAN